MVIKNEARMIQQQQIVKTAGDGTALAALGGWFVGILPSIATLITIVWFCILITEKVTGKPFAECVRHAWKRIRGKADSSK